MSPGASIDWRQQLKDDLHTDMSAKPMVAYFSVLMDYLKKVNAGKKYTLPEQPVFE